MTMQLITQGKGSELTEMQKETFEQDVSGFLKDLQFSLNLQAIAFALPLSVIQKYIFTNLTKQTFNWTSISIINLMIAISYTWATIYYQSLKETDNMGFGISMQPSRDLMTMNAMLDDINYNVVNIALLIAFIAGLTWFRILLALQATE